MADQVEFGDRVPGATYVERPGAYAVIANPNGELAFVRLETGKLYLLGGGSEPDETPAEALQREILEECGFLAEIGQEIGRATQFLFAPQEGFFAIRAVYLWAKLTRRVTMEYEYEPVWIFPTDAIPILHERVTAGL